MVITPGNVSRINFEKNYVLDRLSVAYHKRRGEKFRLQIGPE